MRSGRSLSTAMESSERTTVLVKTVQDCFFPPHRVEYLVAIVAIVVCVCGK